eukprot:1160196-Pelagomonas_calceolata.AAC.2
MASGLASDLVHTAGCYGDVMHPFLNAHGQIYRFKERTGSHTVGLIGLVLVLSSTLKTDGTKKKLKKAGRSTGRKTFV